MGNEGNPWKTHIVMSSVTPSQLPQSMKHDGVKEVCVVETILRPQDMKRKNHHWYNLRKEYNLAEFDVRILIGAGLKFEIWSKDGVRSRDHDDIEVQWENGEGRTRPDSKRWSEMKIERLE